MGLAALALAVAVALLPDPLAAQPGVPGPAAPAKDEAKRNLASPHAHTAIGAVIDANGGRLPASGAELMSALAKLGDFVQLPVSFSAVALDSGLTHPRVVITMRPSAHPAPVDTFVPNGRVTFSSWGGSSVGGETKKLLPPAQPLNQLAVNHTQLEGRLFLAANTEAVGDGLRVRTIEFISWNCRKLKFDFGVIDGLADGAPELKLLDGVRCFSCHKNRAPILGVAPWSNTTHNALVRATTEQTLFKPLKLSNGLELRAKPDTDGMAPLAPQAQEVDTAVRVAGDLLRDRAAFQHLLATPAGRKAFVLMCTAVLARGPLEKTDQLIRAELNTIPLGRFARDAQAVYQGTVPGTLGDYSPAGPVHKEVTTWAKGTLQNRVLRYDEDRAEGGRHTDPEHVPSNPKAFVPTPARPVTRTSDVVNAVLLAQTLGLTEKDRAFLADALDEAVKRLHDPAATRPTVAVAVLTGPAFADVLTTGTLPDRDDFKDRFAAGLVALVKKQTLNGAFWVPRDTYASAPRIDPAAKPEKEVEALPSHACLRCHDVRGAAKAAFSPIPPLAFDPFDATARDAWVKAADRKRRAEVLGRLVKRLDADKNMPPADSTEYALYRTKEPAAIDEVRQWLDAELKAARGK
jgi:hypothetical protein